MLDLRPKALPTEVASAGFSSSTPTCHRYKPCSRAKGSDSASPVVVSTFCVQMRARTSRKTASMRAALHSWSTEMRVSSKVGEKRTPLSQILNSRLRESRATTRRSPTLGQVTSFPFASTTTSSQLRTLCKSSRRLCTCQVHPLSTTRRAHRATWWAERHAGGSSSWPAAAFASPTP